MVLLSLLLLLLTASASVSPSSLVSTDFHLQVQSPVSGEVLTHCRPGEATLDVPFRFLVLTSSPTPVSLQESTLDLLLVRDAGTPLEQSYLPIDPAGFVGTTRSIILHQTFPGNRSLKATLVKKHSQEVVSEVNVSFRIECEDKFQLLVRNPAPDSVVYCEKGELRATTHLQLSLIALAYDEKLVNSLDVEIYLDPDYHPNDSFLGRLPLVQTLNSHPFLSYLMPGRRCLELKVVNQRNVSLFTLKTWFNVSCGEGEDGILNTMSSYDSSINRSLYFSSVYKYNAWHNSESLSGPGSTTRASRNASEFIVDLVESLPEKSLNRFYDIPCGDLNWMKHLLPFLLERDISYMGFDISKDIVLKNRRRFESLHEVGFEVLDVVTDDLPKMTKGDIILCRHLMLHLSVSDNMAILYKLVSSQADWMLLTTYETDEANDENDKVFPLYIGHKINLLRRPYCLPEPLHSRIDGPGLLGLWDIRDYNEKNAKYFFSSNICN